MSVNGGKLKKKGRQGSLFTFNKNKKKNKRLPANKTIKKSNNDSTSVPDVRQERGQSIIMKFRMSVFVGAIKSMTSGKNEEIDLDEIEDIKFVQQHTNFSPEDVKNSKANIIADSLTERRDPVLNVLQTFNMNSLSSPPTRKKIEESFNEVVDFRADDPVKMFSKVSLIGKAQNAEIWQCSAKNKNRIPFVNRKKGSSTTYVSAKICNVVSPTEIFQEVALLKLCKGHPNIVQHIFTYFTGKTSDVWIVCEFMKSSIADILYRCESMNGYSQIKSPWKDKYIAYVMREILQAIDFLHRNFRLHRNIKCENFLWDESGQIKLTHFGEAIPLSAEETKVPGKAITSKSFWTAPEILQGEEYDTAVDIWSLGVSGIELATGDPPFRVRETAIRAQVLIITQPAPKLPKSFGGKAVHWSEDCAHFIEIMLNKDQDERPSAQELLLHPFLQQATSSLDFTNFARRMKEGFL